MNWRKIFRPRASKQALNQLSDRHAALATRFKQLQEKLKKLAKELEAIHQAKLDPAPPAVPVPAVEEAIEVPNQDGFKQVHECIRALWVELEILHRRLDEKPEKRDARHD